MILVHGAGSGPWVFDGWRDALAGLQVDAVDLHAGLDVGEAAMSNYAAVVARAADSLPRPLALCGWSMGGLAAMLAAREAGAERLAVLEPSPPAEVQGWDPGTAPETGTFDPEQEYGPFPAEVRARPESRLARSERKRGVSVPALPCPLLVVSGREFPEERGAAIARFYGADERSFADLDHWGLVLDGRVASEVAAWLAGEDGALDAQCGVRPAPEGAGKKDRED